MYFLTMATYSATVVSPAELEGHILAHPDVADVCVVGVPDEYSGEVAMAFVVLHPDATARARRDLKESRKVKMGIMKVCRAAVVYRRLGN